MIKSNNNFSICNGDNSTCTLHICILLGVFTCAEILEMFRVDVIWRGILFDVISNLPYRPQIILVRLTLVYSSHCTNNAHLYFFPMNNVLNNSQSDYRHFVRLATNQCNLEKAHHCLMTDRSNTVNSKRWFLCVILFVQGCHLYVCVGMNSDMLYIFSKHGCWLAGVINQTCQEDCFRKYLSICITVKLMPNFQSTCF